MDFTYNEIADAKRDMMALVRADHDGADADIDAIIGAAGERELRALARVFTSAYGDLVLRCTIAVNGLENEELETFIASADRDVLTADPDIHAAVGKKLADIQAGIILDT